MSNRAKIDDTSIVRCQWCGEDALASNWDDVSFKECTSREMRREYRSICEKFIWKAKADYYYKCPNCSMWSKADQLILLGKDKQIVRDALDKPISALGSIINSDA